MLWCQGAQNINGLSNHKLKSALTCTIWSAVLLLNSLMPSSHRRHGQDKTALSCLVLSCPCRRCELNSRQVKTVGYKKNFKTEHVIAVFAVLSCLEMRDSTKLFSLKCIENYWKLSWLVINSVHTTDTDKTRQSCLVLSVSAVWTRHKSRSRLKKTNEDFTRVIAQSTKSTSCTFEGPHIRYWRITTLTQSSIFISTCAVTAPVTG